MTSFLSEREKKISKEFDANGFIVKDIKDLSSLKKIRNTFIDSIKKNISNASYKKKNDEDLL